LDFFFISSDGTKEDGSDHGKVYGIYTVYNPSFCVPIGLMQRGQSPLSPIIINGCRPLAITKAEFFQALRSPRIGQRALYWTRRGQPFVKILRQGGRGCTLLIDTLSAEIFYTDLLEGRCEPPPMRWRAQERLPVSEEDLRL
jgi:hypothetical protein